MNYYEVLDVSRTATQKDIRRAYLELAQIYHPDRLRGMRPNVRKRAEEKMKMINKAYTILRNPVERASYDSKLGQQYIEDRMREIILTNSVEQEGGRLKNKSNNEKSEGLFGLWSSFRSLVKQWRNE